jgi:hypothetical protein
MIISIDEEKVKKIHNRPMTKFLSIIAIKGNLLTVIKISAKNDLKDNITHNGEG